MNFQTSRCASLHINVSKVLFRLQKESKPKEKKAPKEEAPPADEEDEAPKPKPEKSPLDSLPPSPMVMDAWKRLYSNTKGSVFREVAVKGEGWSHPFLHIVFLGMMLMAGEAGEAGKAGWGV